MVFRGVADGEVRVVTGAKSGNNDDGTVGVGEVIVPGLSLQFELRWHLRSSIAVRRNLLSCLCLSSCAPLDIPRVTAHVCCSGRQHQRHVVDADDNLRSVAQSLH